MTVKTDANNKNTNYAYNALNQLISVTNALNQTTSYGYDDSGNLITITDANNHTFTMAYDELNRKITGTDALSHSYSWEYDTAGNIISWTKPDQAAVSYEYTTKNQLSTMIYPDLSQVTFTYDDAGNRLSMTDPLGTTTYAYDELNRLISLTRGSNTVSYGYDDGGNLASLTYPGGLEVDYDYNERNQLTSVADPVNTTTITYDDAGNRTGEILPNGVHVNYTYDNAGRLAQVEHVLGQTTLAKAAYTLDNVGNRLTETDEQDQTTEYTYDDINQLISAEYPGGPTVDYEYDPAGNRTLAGSTTYTYDDANRITQAGNDTYTYDDNGNLTSINGTTQYQYDTLNRLVSSTDGTDTIEYTYDGDGNRLSQTVTGVNNQDYDYFNVPLAGLSRVLVELNSDENYIYGSRALYRSSAAGDIFYHNDGLGSTMLVTDDSGNILNSYKYDAFGNIRSANETVENSILFTGEFQDENGLIYLRARYYDPNDGRFLSQDSYPGDYNDPGTLNRYAYGNNNPVINIDPTGHVAICAEGGGIIALTALAALVIASDIYINTPEGKQTINEMYKALGQSASSANLKLNQIADTVRTYVNSQIQNNDIDPRDNTVYVFINRQKEVTYVGRSNDFNRRRNEHKDTLEKNKYRMVPVMTGLSKNEARGVEQVLISSYTLDALDNARREIAVGNVYKAGQEGARAAKLLASYPENEWLDLMGR